MTIPDLRLPITDGGIQILLNSIALEPNRWTAEKIAWFNLLDLLGPISAAGFDAVEVWQHHVSRLTPAELQQLVSTSRDLGISFPVLGIYPHLHRDSDDGQQDLGEIIRMLDIAITLGADTVKMFVGSVASEELTRSQRDRTMTALAQVVKAAEGRDLRITGETHANTLFDTLSSCQQALAEINSDTLKVCFQPLDSADDERAASDFKALEEHIVHIHLQGRIDGEMALLEESDLDYTQFLTMVKQSDFAGYLCIEFVKDCVVASPELLDVDLVLRNATRDLAFVTALVS